MKVMETTGEEEISMKVVLYAKEDCQECERIKALLYHLNISYLEYKLGTNYTQEQFFSEFGSDATYPQITVDYRHIGKMKDFLNYLKEKNVI
jgi:glutaredoxin